MLKYIFNLCVGKIYKPQTERTNKWLITAVNNVVEKKVIKKMYTLEMFSFTPDLPLETMLINRKKYLKLPHKERTQYIEITVTNRKTI